MQYDPAQQRITTPAHGEHGLDAAEWHELCQAAYENLPTFTQITEGEIDAILSHCIGIYLDALGISYE